MYEFLDRLMTVALPRVRDFRGIKAKGFDGRGNYTLGVQEQIIFPGEQGYEVHLPPRSQVLPLKKTQGGHWVIPCDNSSHEVDRQRLQTCEDLSQLTIEIESKIFKGSAETGPQDLHNQQVQVPHHTS